MTDEEEEGWDEEGHTLYLSPAAWNQLQAELDKPAEVVPALAELFRRHRELKHEPPDSRSEEQA